MGRQLPEGEQVWLVGGASVLGAGAKPGARSRAVDALPDLQ